MYVGQKVKVNSGPSNFCDMEGTVTETDDKTNKPYPVKVKLDKFPRAVNFAACELTPL